MTTIRLNWQNLHTTDSIVPIYGENIHVVNIDRGLH